MVAVAEWTALGKQCIPSIHYARVIMANPSTSRKTDPEIVVVSLTAVTKKGPVTLHFAPKAQDAAEPLMRDRARGAMRRYLARANIGYETMTSTTTRIPSSKAQKLCVFTDPTTGTERPALC